MRHILSLLSLAVLLSLVCTLQAEDKKATSAEGKAIELFNGKDLTGWKTWLDPKSKVEAKDVWSISDGIIICKGKPNGYIITEKEYGDYVLTLEWRWAKGSKGGNSGVLCHVSGADKVWPKSWEAQLMAGKAGEIWLVDGFKLDVDKERQNPKQARNFYRITKDKKVEKDIGEWNTYKITCKGDTVKLEVNGELVNEGKAAEATKGKILLQSEGAEVHFRNISLTPIK